MCDWGAELRARLAALRLPPTRELAIVEELSQHLAERQQDLIAGGASPEEAARLTLAELDRADLLVPRLAALRRPPLPPLTPGVPSTRLFSGLWHDLRYAVRTLRRQPVVALVAAITLALGIGLNTSMFSFLNTLLLRPLPFPEPAQLVKLFRTTPDNQYGGFSRADYLALEREEAVFGRFAGYQPAALALSDAGRGMEWLRVSPDLFEVLGVRPELGRLFRPDEAIAGNDRVVVISHAMWQHRFAGAADVVGSTVRAGDDIYEIVGILPAAAGDHRLFGQIGLYSPLSLGDGAPNGPQAHGISILGRRHRAVSASEAAAFIASFGSRRAADLPVENAGTGWRTEALPDVATSPTGRALLYMLLGLSSCVLLVACSNLANLLLARAIERSREFAVRAALGASRVQLIRTLALESLVLVAAGGAGALAVAGWTTGWLRSVVVNGGGPEFDFRMDWRVMTFALGVSALAVLLCGVVPALFTSRINATDTLKGGGRCATATPRHRRIRHVLIGGQFAMAMMLLAAAGFFLRGAANLLAEHYGWNAGRVLQGEIALPSATYPHGTDITRFQQQLLERVRHLPGVAAASVSYGLPFLGLRGDGRYIGDGKDGGRGTEGLAAKLNGVTSSYFDVTGTPLLAGRPFSDADNASSPKVAIINDALARALFPTGDPLGRRVGSVGADSADWMEVVGVVGGVRSIDVAQTPAPFQLYQPTAQDPRAPFVLAVRTAGVASGPVVPALRAAIASLDPEATVRGLMTATARMEEVTSQMYLIRQLLTAFAVLALLLAALGIYGAMTRMVVQRTEEIGVRMALGAELHELVSMILGAGARIVVPGAAFGLIAAIGLSRLLGAVLPSMEINAALVGGATMAVLMAVAWLACWLPARRAAQVDPAVALRGE